MYEQGKALNFQTVPDNTLVMALTSSLNFILTITLFQPGHQHQPLAGQRCTQYAHGSLPGRVGCSLIAPVCLAPTFMFEWAWMTPPYLEAGHFGKKPEQSF